MKGGMTKGHESLGYVGNGVYACTCGEEFKAGEGPIKAGGDGDTKWLAVKDQWQAHKKEAANAV